MITKEQFIKLITNHLKWSDDIDRVSEAFKADLLECDWADYANVLFDTFLDYTFDDFGRDIIYSQMYEDADYAVIDDKDIDISSVEDLWEVVKDHRK